MKQVKRTLLASLVIGLASPPLANAATVELRGRVVHSGRPVEGALLRVVGPREPDDRAVEVEDGRSDSDGRFALTIPWNEARYEPAGRLLEVTAPGLMPRVVELGDLYFPGPGSADHLGSIRLDRSCTVEGSLRAPPDERAASSTLVLWREGLDRPTAQVRAAGAPGSHEIPFRFPPVGPGPYTLGLIRGDAVAERLGSIEACASRHARRWHPAPLAITRGRVVDEGGDPVPGAAVRALAPSPAGGPPRWLDPPPRRTDRLGSFRVPHPATRPWLLEVERAGFQTHRASLECTELRPGACPEVTVRLRSSARVSGAIFAADEIEYELEGAEVVILPLSPGQTIGATRVCSDADGEFLSPILPPGGYRVTARAEGYQPSETIVSISGDSHEAARTRFTLEPDGTASLHLAVVDAHGEPVANAEIWIQHEGSSLHRNANLDSDGTATLMGLPTGLELSITVLHAWHELSLHDGHRIDRDGSSVRIDLPPTPWEVVSARGIAEDEQGRPVADARVEAFLLNRHSGPTYRGVTDHDGRFTVGPMPDGAYWVRVDADGFARSVTGLKVAPGEPIHRVTIYRGATLWGEVPGASADGSWRVFADRLSESDRLDSYQPTISFRGYPSEMSYGKVFHGGYRIERVPPGRWVVIAERGEGVDRIEHRAANEISPGDRSVRLDLERFETDFERLDVPLVGRVTDADTGAGLPRVEVRAGTLWYTSSGELAKPAAHSGEDGAFLLEPGLALPVRLSFHRDGFARGEVLVASETAVREIEVALEPTPGLSYRVEWFDGANVVLHGLTLENQAGERFECYGLDCSQARGHWRSAPRGRHTLEVDYQWGVVRVPVDIPGPEVGVVLPPTGVAALRIPDLELEMGDGWLDDVVVTATPVGEPSGRSPVTERSVYYLGLSPGRWRIDVTASEARFWTTEVEIRNRVWATASLR